MADRAALCRICRTRIATHTCSLCGKRVCDSDFDSYTGMCLRCKSGRTASKSSR